MNSIPALNFYDIKNSLVFHCTHPEMYLVVYHLNIDNAKNNKGAIESWFCYSQMNCRSSTHVLKPIFLEKN